MQRVDLIWIMILTNREFFKNQKNASIDDIKELFYIFSWDNAIGVVL